MWMLFLFACGAPCPEGLVRDGGQCVADGEAVPLSAGNFPARHDAAGCHAVERCLCSGSSECEAQCAATDWTWIDGCAFDLDIAQECLAAEWACDPGDAIAYAPVVCEQVYYDCP